MSRTQRKGLGKKAKEKKNNNTTHILAIPNEIFVTYILPLLSYADIDNVGSVSMTFQSYYNAHIIGFFLQEVNRKIKCHDEMMMKMAYRIWHIRLAFRYLCDNFQRIPVNFMNPINKLVCKCRQLLTTDDSDSLLKNINFLRELREPYADFYDQLNQLNQLNYNSYLNYLIYSQVLINI